MRRMVTNGVSARDLPLRGEKQAIRQVDRVVEILLIFILDELAKKLSLKNTNKHNCLENISSGY